MRMHRSSHVLYLFLFTYALLLSGCSNDSVSTSPNSATVKEVVDGDTIDIAIGGKTERVRLIGINTPETKHPTKGVADFAQAATQAELRNVGLWQACR
jgi:micrococcal nuclease